MNSEKPFYKRIPFIITLALITLLLAGFMAIVAVVMQNAVNERTQMEGQMRLSGIATEVSSKLNESNVWAGSIATQVERLLLDDVDDAAQLQEFVANQTRDLFDQTGGEAFSVYVAYNGQLYIDGFDPNTSSFVLADRAWYVGAKKNRGELFVTAPYVDAYTHKMCYSVSKLLNDGDTVVGIDYSLSDVQRVIEEMSAQGGGISLIVDKKGIVVGHSNHNYVAANYMQLPYQDIVKKVFSLYGNAFVSQVRDKNYTVYSDKTEQDWYLITFVENSNRIFGVAGEMFWVLVAIAILSVCVIAFYIISYRNRVKAEQKVHAQHEYLRSLGDELKKPLATIVSQSKMRNLGEWGHENSMDMIQESASLLGGVLDDYLNQAELESEKRTVKVSRQEKRQNTGRGYVRQTYLIIAILTMTSIFAIVANTIAQINQSNVRMINEKQEYYAQTREWIAENRTTLNTLAQSFTANPGMVKDYDETIQYLDDMVSDIESISVAYIVNPLWEHTVMMNNGWEPKAGWKVEERDWYVGTMESENGNGFHISSPYFDEQTGYYCVTISRIVYDMSGNMIGVLGIDYYLDKLVEILGKSYTDDGYAFLTDSNYVILNHPYEDYQMTLERSVSAGELAYRDALTKENVTWIKDYDGHWKACLVQEEEVSGLCVIVVKNWWAIYGNAILWDLVFVLVFGLCIYLVTRIMRNLNFLQERITSELLVAADNANAANKAKSDFLAQMSHEIRTPINAVLGMNEMILRETDNPEILEYSGNIKSAGRTLLSLINSILDFSKIEDGKMEILPVAYDTASLINDLVQMIATRANDKSLELKLDIDENLPKTLYGDDVRIRQVATNLLTNAVKYTKVGSVTLRIHGKKQADSGKYVIAFAVEDTGIGIKKEDMDKLAVSFQRLEETRNRNIEGTGLGISIVKRLLEMMGSKLEVSSVYGSGSVFSFELEQGVVEDIPIGDYAKRYAESLERRNHEVVLQAPGAKVLVVDDNSINLKVAAGLMKKYAFYPDTANSGRACLDKVRYEKYDIIFMDHMMPEMDGIETLKALKAENLIPEHTHVLMMTANAISGAREEYLKEGFEDYLTKPIETDKLEHMLKKYLPSHLVSFVQAESAEKKQTENRTAVTGTGAAEPATMEKEIAGMDEKQQNNVVSGTDTVMTEQTISAVEEEADSDHLSEAQITKMQEMVEGLNVSAGLIYCMDSKSFYYEVIKDYIEADKEPDLNRFLAEENMHDYGILVHALKSTSKTIGAEELFNEALELEMAAKAGNVEAVRAGHENAMEHYRKLCEQLRKYLDLQER